MDNHQTIFKEQQRFKKSWIVLFLWGFFFFWVYMIIQQLVLNKPFGNHPMSNTVLIVSGLFYLLMMWGFFSIKLHTQIDSNGISVKFFPFIKHKIFLWKDISNCYVRTYKPIIEYGGWGYRMGMGNGVAYNISGNIGIQLELTNKKKILIGTNQGEEAERAIALFFENKTQ
jgi:cellulose synthase/poly-beta-1,6-N-acetylglucosamine synthase-like glycosyltransferase